MYLKELLPMGEVRQERPAATATSFYALTITGATSDRASDDSAIALTTWTSPDLSQLLETGMQSWTIGNQSRQKVDLPLNDESVSGLHANLTRTDDGRWRLQDNNSTNGTARYINGRWVKISQANVRPDEKIRFGKVEASIQQLIRGCVISGPSWRQDLASSIPKIMNYDEFKKNLSFSLSLIATPTRSVLLCASQRQPINPFSFMLFSGLLSIALSASGISLRMFTSPIALSEAMLEAAPKFLPVLVITLLFNAILFPAFSYAAKWKHSFDDFMRLTAVLSGVGWVINSALIVVPLQQSKVPANDASILIIMVLVAFVMQATLTVTTYRRFWRMSYPRTIACYMLSLFAVAAFAAVLGICVGVINYVSHSA
jgi:hypothetical protein